MATTENEVAAQIESIKRNMPAVYKAIQERADLALLGKEAYALVRRGLRGEANCFYAFQRGFVVGTPFTNPAEIMADVAVAMVTFGTDFCVIWPWRGKGQQHGSH